MDAAERNAGCASASKVRLVSSDGFGEGGIRFFVRMPGNTKKTEKNIEKSLHFPESMIYYLFITLRNKGSQLQFRL